MKLKLNQTLVEVYFVSHLFFVLCNALQKNLADARQWLILKTNPCVKMAKCMNVSMTLTVKVRWSAASEAVVVFALCQVNNSMSLGRNCQHKLKLHGLIPRFLIFNFLVNLRDIIEINKLDLSYFVILFFIKEKENHDLI